MVPYLKLRIWHSSLGQTASLAPLKVQMDLPLTPAAQPINIQGELTFRKKICLSGTLIFHIGSGVELIRSLHFNPQAISDFISKIPSRMVESSVQMGQAIVHASR
jgi:hypothetical protein